MMVAFLCSNFSKSSNRTVCVSCNRVVYLLSCWSRLVEFLCVYMYVSRRWQSNTCIDDHANNVDTRWCSREISPSIIIWHLYSAMPRGPMKAVLSYCIPEVYYRPFYSLASALLIQLLVLCWHPMPTVIWDFQHPILWYLIMGKKYTNLC